MMSPGSCYVSGGTKGVTLYDIVERTVGNTTICDFYLTLKQDTISQCFIMYVKSPILIQSFTVMEAFKSTLSDTSISSSFACLEERHCAKLSPSIL
jgi:hypothetical protein